MNRRQRSKVDYVSLARGVNLRDLYSQVYKVSEVRTSDGDPMESDDENTEISLSQKYPVFVDDEHVESDVEEPVELTYETNNELEKVITVRLPDKVTDDSRVVHQSGAKKKKIIDPGKGTWVCERCDRVLSNHVGGIRAHQMSCYPIPAGGLPYSCGVCSDRFGSLGLLERHFLLEHPNSSIRFPCVFCLRSFSKCHLLRDHAFNHHRIVWLLDIPFILDIHCRSCGEEFSSTNDLADHLQRKSTRCDPFVLIDGLPVGRTIDIDSVAASAAEVSLKSARQLPGRARYEAVTLPSSESSDGVAPSKVSVRIVDELETGDQRSVPVVLRAFRPSSSVERKPRRNKDGKVPLSKSKVDLQLKRKLNRIRKAVDELRCQHCRRLFDSKAEVQRHVQLVHKGKRVLQNGAAGIKEQTILSEPLIIISAKEKMAAERALRKFKSRTHVRNDDDDDDDSDNTGDRAENHEFDWPFSPEAHLNEESFSVDDGVESEEDPSTTVVEVLRPQSSILNRSCLKDEDDNDDEFMDYEAGSPSGNSLLVPPPDTGLYLSVEQGERRTEIQFVVNGDDLEDNVNSMVVTQHDLSCSKNENHRAFQFAQEDDAPLSHMARTLEELPPAPRPSRARGRGSRGVLRTRLWTETRPLIIPPARVKKPAVVRGPRGRPRGSCSNQSMRGRTLAAPSVQVKSVTALACEECVRLFSSAASLEAHVRARHSVFRAPPADYPALPAVPSLPPARLRAAMTAGPRGAAVLCSRGGARRAPFLAAGSPRHILQQKNDVGDETPFCQPCGRQFSDVNAYAAHCRVRHAQSADLSVTHQIVCSLCKMLFPGRLQRDSHIQAKHSDHVGFECLRCGQQLEQIFQLNTHLRRQHNLAPEGNFELLLGSVTEQQNDAIEVADSAVTTNSSVNNVVVSSTVQYRSEPFNCTICGVAFARPDSLAAHYSFVHVNGVPNPDPATSASAPQIRCLLCEEGFASTEQHDTHVRVEHDADGAFDCAACDAVFASFLSLRRHHRHAHKLFTDFVNSGQAGSTRQPLPSMADGNDDSENEEQILLGCADLDDNAVEVRVRTSDMLSVIRSQLESLCQQDVGQEDAAAAVAAAKLVKELSSSSADAQLLLYVCQQCGEGFNNKCEMAKHVIGHAKRRQRFGCKRCGRIFEGVSSRKDLIDHVKVDHMGKPAAQCLNCLQKFTFTSSFKKHRRQHRCDNSGNHLRQLSAYGCSVCDKIFCASGAQSRFQRHCANCPGVVIRARPPELPSQHEEESIVSNAEFASKALASRQLHYKGKEYSGIVVEDTEAWLDVVQPASSEPRHK